MTARYAAPLGALLLSLAVPVRAATCTWGGGAGAWSTASAWSCGAVPTGADDVVVGSGTVTLDVPARARTLTFSGGTLDGPADLVVEGTTVWEAGGMLGAGTTTLEGQVTFSGATGKDIGRRVVLGATTEWTNGTLQFRDGGALVNDAGSLFKDVSVGSHSMARVGTITTEPQVINRGVWTVDSGGTNTNVDVVNEGTMGIGGQGLDVNAPGRFTNLGTLSGWSLLDTSSGAVVSIGGTTMPNGAVVGTMPVRGPFTMTGDHVLDLDVTSATDFDRVLTDSGVIAIAGRLRLRIGDAGLAGLTIPILSASGTAQIVGCYAPEDVVAVAPDGYTTVPYAVTVACTGTGVTVTLQALNTAGEGGPARAGRLEATGANPFAGRTTLALELPASGRATVEALDLLGRCVAVLFDGPVVGGQPASIAFEAGALPAGRYVVRATADGAALSLPLTLVR